MPLSEASYKQVFFLREVWEPYRRLPTYRLQATGRLGQQLLLVLLGGGITAAEVAKMPANNPPANNLIGFAGGVVPPLGSVCLPDLRALAQNHGWDASSRTEKHTSICTKIYRCTCMFICLYVYVK